MYFDSGSADENRVDFDNHRLPETPTIVTNRPSENPTNLSPEQIDAKLKGLARRSDECSLQIATLIAIVHTKRLWVEFAGSFREYVETHLGFKLRTIQEMLRVLRICEGFQITPEQISRFGWSKVAVVASQITLANKEQLLADLGKMSYAQLREKYRPAFKKSKSQNEAGREGTFWGSDSVLVLNLTPELRAALEYASDLTGLEDLQSLVEFIADRFLDLSITNARPIAVALMN